MRRWERPAFRLVSPGSKVIVSDPWLSTYPLTPPACKQFDSCGRTDVLLVTHGRFDHIADAPALAQQYNVPVRGPGDLLNTVMTLGVLPAHLLPRMNNGGTVEAAFSAAMAGSSVRVQVARPGEPLKF